MTESTHPEPARCAYCGVTGNLEQINAQGNQACAATTLCRLRQAGEDPVMLTLRLARELSQQHRTEMTEAHSSGIPGSQEWARHAGAYQGMLSGQDLAWLHLVLRAASDWLSGSNRAEWGRQLRQARADLGCRRCGAMGPYDPCTTETGLPARRWHAGRTF